MIRFRCWYCNRAYSVPDAKARQRRDCSCGSRIKVPRRSGGSSKALSLGNFAVEFLVYGTGGAILGFGLGALIFGRLPIGRAKLYIVAGMTVLGLVLGGLGGEPVINWIGRKIRDREED